MKNKIIKLGVVGLGRGKTLASEIAGYKHVKLRAICDKNSKKLESAKKFFSKEKKIKDLLCFDNFEDFINSDVEAVIIATDATNHVSYVIKALNADKHVISEIPAINSLKEAKELRKAVKAHPHLKYMVGENCCYWAFIEAWKKMYEEDEFGDVVYAESEYLHAKDFNDYKPPEEPDHWRTYNPAIKYITHNLGPLLYIMNDKIDSVTCMESSVKYNPYRNGSASGAALFKTKKGAIIRIFICFGAYVGFDHNFRIVGTKGTIETDNTKPLEKAHSFARLSDIQSSLEEKIDIPVTLKFPGEADGEHGGADYKMMKAFIDCIINDTPPPLDVDFGITISLPGILAHESAVMESIPIKVPDVEEL